MISDIMDCNQWPFHWHQMWQHLHHNTYLHTYCRQSQVFMDLLRQELRANMIRSPRVLCLTSEYLCIHEFASSPNVILMILSCPIAIYRWITDWYFFDVYWRLLHKKLNKVVVFMQRKPTNTCKCSIMRGGHRHIQRKFHNKHSNTIYLKE